MRSFRWVLGVVLLAAGCSQILPVATRTPSRLSLSPDTHHQGFGVGTIIDFRVTLSDEAGPIVVADTQNIHMWLSDSSVADLANERVTVKKGAAFTWVFASYLSLRDSMPIATALPTAN